MSVYDQAFGTAILIAMVLLIAYQAFMLVWTKRTTGGVPVAIRVLRGVNIALLLVGIVLVAMYWAGKG